MVKRKALRRDFFQSLLVVLLVICLVPATIYAWYIYNTNAKTTQVHLAAGSSVQLQISNAYDGDYGSATVLDTFRGALVPVSTNSISNGFQKVSGFTKEENDSQMESILATYFSPSFEKDYDYYKTLLFIRTNSSDLSIYVQDIGYEDSDLENPISSALRLGLQVHAPGNNQPVISEYIFEINQEKNPKKQYNTKTGKEGYVIDSLKVDGSTLLFKPFSSSNFVDYEKNTGKVTKKEDSLCICTISNPEEGVQSEPIQIDVYVWLEGCDEDCYNNLCGQYLKNLSISFAGIKE